MLPGTLATDKPDLKKRDKLSADKTEYRNLHTKQYAPFIIGDKVWLQHPDTKDWYTQATIISPRAGGSYVIKTDSGKEYIRGRRFLRLVNTPQNQTAISRRLYVKMPRQSKYRDSEERIEHYDNLRRWDNTLQILPFTTSLREIRDIQHYYNGIPVSSYLCLPRQEGDDQKPQLGDETDIRQSDREQPSGPTPFFTNGRRSQHDLRSYSGWYRHVEGLQGVPEVRDQERGQSPQGNPRPSTSRGGAPELQRRQRRQRWRWVTTERRSEDEEAGTVPRRRSPLRRVADQSGAGR